MLKVSVVLTTYNGSRFLVQQLDSIMEQTRKPDEIIISDDASTDDTVDIVGRFIEEKHLDSVTFLRNNKNIGFISNFRLALSHATGDYIFLCDQDDIWNMDKIEKMLCIMSKNSNIKALVTSFQKIDKNGAHIDTTAKQISTNHGFLRKKIRNGELVSISSNEILYCNISPGCTSGYKREIVEKYLSIPSNTLSVPHDWALNILAQREQGLYYLNEPTIRYRLHDSNAIGIMKRAMNSVERSSVIGKHVNQLEEILLYPGIQSARKKIQIILSLQQHRINALITSKLSSWMIGLPKLVKAPSFYIGTYLMDLKYIIKAKIQRLYD